MERISYSYRNLPVRGSSPMTGLVFGRKNPGILFARSKTGGVLQYRFSEGDWYSYSAGAGEDRKAMNHPLAIGLWEDPDSDLVSLFSACGSADEDEGLLCITEDGGENYYINTVPAAISGKQWGNGSGPRMAFGRNATIYLATQTAGLMRTKDAGATWEIIDLSLFSTENRERNVTCVWCGEGDNSSTIVFGCNGAGNAVEENGAITRGHGLYASFDGGITFDHLAMPEYPEKLPGIRGYVPYRMSWDGQWLYVTLQGTEENSPEKMALYGTDSGIVPAFGRIVRYRFEDNRLTATEDITPGAETFRELVTGTRGLFGNRREKLDPERYPFAFAGIDCAAGTGILAVTVPAGRFGSLILRSQNAGEDWEVVYHSEKPIGADDIKINPFDPENVWVITDQGLLVTMNFGEQTRVNWGQKGKAPELSVHPEVYAMPMKHKPGIVISEKSMNLLDLTDRFGGTVLRKWDDPAGDCFCDEKGNGYDRIGNADFADTKPDCFVVSAGTDASGEIAGALLLTGDGGNHFDKLSLPGPELPGAELFAEALKKPFASGGRCAMSADGATILWGMAEDGYLPDDGVFLTTDSGKNWEKVRVFSLPKIKNPRLNHFTGEEINKGPKERRTRRNPNSIRIFADRADAELFFGFGENFRVYVSPDGGRNFYEYPVPEELPNVNNARIGAGAVQIRGESGKTGVFWIAAGQAGLWRMEYDRVRDVLRFECVTGEGSFAKAIGFGIGRNVTERHYLEQEKTIYFAGSPEGMPCGIYRSEDGAGTWVRINTDSTQFGEILSLDGDCRMFGRFYIGTGTMGLLMGEDQTIL